MSSIQRITNAAVRTALIAVKEQCGAEVRPEHWNAIGLIAAALVANATGRILNLHDVMIADEETASHDEQMSDVSS